MSEKIKPAFSELLPPGTRLALGPGIAAVTDEPEYVPPPIGSVDPDVFFPTARYTKGVGYGDTHEKATLAAIADYLAKKGAI